MSSFPPSQCSQRNDTVHRFSSATLQVLACGVHRALRDLLNVLEELGLGRAGVAQQEHVDVAPEAVGAGGMLLLAAKQRQRDARLDVEVAIDGGRYALEDALACMICIAHAERDIWHSLLAGRAHA